MVLAAVVLTACGSERTEVTISAASSLTELAEQLEAELESHHPDVDVRLNFGGTAGLVAQIRSGAPVDILLAADEIALPADDELTLETGAIATNELVVATPPDSVLTLDDLANPDLRVVACDPAVPCGRLAAWMLTNIPLAPYDIRPDSLEPNVRLVRQRILSGEADVGFIYRTDVADQDLSVLELGTEYRNTVTAVRLTESAAATSVMSTLLDGATVPAIASGLGFGQP